MQFTFKVAAVLNKMASLTDKQLPTEFEHSIICKTNKLNQSIPIEKKKASTKFPNQGMNMLFMGISAAFLISFFVYRELLADFNSYWSLIFAGIITGIFIGGLIGIWATRTYIKFTDPQQKQSVLTLIVWLAAGIVPFILFLLGVIYWQLSSFAPEFYLPLVTVSSSYLIGFFIVYGLRLKLSLK